MKKILLCHSGENETLATIPALGERYGAAVAALTVDVGQDGTAAAWRERALAAGAVRAHVLDAREDFAQNYVLLALHACAIGDDAAEQGAALHRSLLADKLAGVAAMEGASIVAHGLDPHSDEALELERLVLALRRDLVVVAAHSFQTGGPSGRKFDSPGRPHQSQNVVSVESTLWWRRALLDVAEPSQVPRRIPGVRQGLFTVTPVEFCPPGAASLEIAFSQGVPASINGVDMPLIELIEAIDTIAGDHGVGRTIAATDLDGTSRVAISEAPAARVLGSAYAALARAIESRALWRLHRQLGKKYAELIRSGGWHADTRLAIDGFAAETRNRISGTVTLVMRRSRCTVKSVETERTAMLQGASARPAAGRPAVVNAPLPH